MMTILHNMKWTPDMDLTNGHKALLSLIVSCTYVGVSRVGSQNRLKFAVYKSEMQQQEVTENIVFHEVLI